MNESGGAVGEREEPPLDVEPREVQVFSLFDDIINRLGGLPCDGHEDFAAGTFLFHRERECPARLSVNEGGVVEPQEPR